MTSDNLMEHIDHYSIDLLRFREETSDSTVSDYTVTKMEDDDIIEVRYTIKINTEMPTDTADAIAPNSAVTRAAQIAATWSVDSGRKANRTICLVTKYFDGKSGQFLANSFQEAIQTKFAAAGRQTDDINKFSSIIRVAADQKFTDIKKLENFGHRIKKMEEKNQFQNLIEKEEKLQKVVEVKQEPEVTKKVEQPMMKHVSEHQNKNSGIGSSIIRNIMVVMTTVFSTMIFFGGLTAIFGTVAGVFASFVTTVVTTLTLASPTLILSAVLAIAIFMGKIFTTVIENSLTSMVETFFGNSTAGSWILTIANGFFESKTNAQFPSINHPEQGQCQGDPEVTKGHHHPAEENETENEVQSPTPNEEKNYKMIFDKILKWSAVASLGLISILILIILMTLVLLLTVLILILVLITFLLENMKQPPAFFLNSQFVSASKTFWYFLQKLLKNMRPATFLIGGIIVSASLTLMLNPWTFCAGILHGALCPTIPYWWSTILAATVIAISGSPFVFVLASVCGAASLAIAQAQAATGVGVSGNRSILEVGWWDVIFVLLRLAWIGDEYFSQ